MRAILTFVAVCGCVVLGLGYLGAVWPPGDSLAVLRLHGLIAFVLVVAALLVAGAPKRALGFGVLAIAMIFQTGWAQFGAARRGPGDLVLYQKNLLWNGSDPEAILADILSVDPDFVTLQETSTKNGAITEGLRAHFAHHIVCSTDGNGGIALYSRFPFEQPKDRCAFASGMVLAQATLPDGRKLWVGAVHLNWPWPYQQAHQINRIKSALSEIEGPIFLAGDFNMVPWGSSVLGVARAAQARNLGGYLTTFPGFGRFAPLAIDHVMIPKTGQGQIETRPLLGSDHLGLVVRFSF